MQTKKLGFGLMRLPVDHSQICGGIDLNTLKNMVDYFLQEGFTYFDTSYVYHNGYSERAIKAALVDRYPRESFTLADKLPTWMISKKADVEKYLHEQLEKTGAGYFDYYLCHAVTGDNYRTLMQAGVFEEFKRFKEEGKIRHICISFHDTSEVLDQILSEHPEIEFVQIIVNYADFHNDGLEIRNSYDVAVKHHRKVIVMEPVKGGQLANVGKEAQKLFDGFDGDNSVASYAIRFAASQPNVHVVLSGMSTMEQMMDNTSYMKDFVPLCEEEYQLLEQVNEVFDRRKVIHVDSDKLPIHRMIALYNNRKMFPSTDGWQNILYGCIAGRSGSAEELASKEKSPEIKAALRLVADEF